jgi:translation elongation factor EF-4
MVQRQYIRNFSSIDRIDHGETTLLGGLLERERGVAIKQHSVRKHRLFEDQKEGNSA